MIQSLFAMKMNQNGIIGGIPLLIIITAIGILSFLLISSTAPFSNEFFKSINPKSSSHAAVNSSSYPSYPAPLRVFYVSPTGNDSNPGTQTAPWASFFKAASALQAGDEALFADGTYNELEGKSFGINITNSGTVDHPIIFKSQNKRKAILHFSDGVRNTYKIGIQGKNNIIIQDFEITQNAIGTDPNYSDKLIWTWQGSQNTWILGNYLHISQNPFKTTEGASDTIFDGNLLTSCDVCISTFGGTRPTFSNNEIVDPITDGIQSKGGATSVKIFNNYVHTTGANSMSVGIYVGGTSCGSSCGVTDAANLYEGNENVAYNNIIVNANPVRYGSLVMVGCNNCRANNNVIIGGGAAFRMISNTPGWPQTDGTTRIVPTNNPTFENNIIQDCTYPVFYAAGPTNQGEATGTITIDYNNFYNCGTYGMPTQIHNIVGNPNFVNEFSDWHFVNNASPTIGQGISLPTFTGFFGETINTSLDYSGTQRTNPWDLGIYSTQTPTPSPTPNPSSMSNRILWQGKNWYLHGVNMAWINYGSDVGAVSGRASQNQTTISNYFQQIKAANFHVVRWFIFPLPNSNPGYQITVDPTGLPTGVNSNVYTDIDAILNLASQNDLYLDFVLFNNIPDMPNSWWNSTNGQTALVNALGQLTTHYAQNNRILAWELGNEWDKFVYGSPNISLTTLKPLVTQFCSKVHQTSQALCTLSNGGANQLNYFVGTGMDFYQAHWYDDSTPLRTDDYNMYLHDYTYYQTHYGIDKPLVVGEFMAGPWSGGTNGTSNLTPLQKYNQFYAVNNFAGAWGWSFTPSAADGYKIDVTQSQQFTSGKSDLGPIAPTQTPTLSPSCPKASIGDTDCDGTIGIFDYNTVVSNFNKSVPVGTLGDFNKTGVVDIFDYNILVSNYGK